MTGELRTGLIMSLRDALVGCCLGGRMEQLERLNTGTESQNHVVSTVPGLTSLEFDTDHVYDNNITILETSYGKMNLYGNSHHDNDEHIYDNNISLCKSLCHKGLYEVNHVTTNSVKDKLPCWQNEYVRPGFALRTFKRKSSKQSLVATESIDEIDGISYRKTSNLDENYETEHCRGDNAEHEQNSQTRKNSDFSKWWKISSHRKGKRSSSYSFSDSGVIDQINGNADYHIGKYTTNTGVKDIKVEWDLVNGMVNEIHDTCISLTNDSHHNVVLSSSDEILNNNFQAKSKGGNFGDENNEIKGGKSTDTDSYTLEVGDNSFIHPDKRLCECDNELQYLTIVNNSEIVAGLDLEESVYIDVEISDSGNDFYFDGHIILKVNVTNLNFTSLILNYKRQTFTSVLKTLW